MQRIPIADIRRLTLHDGPETRTTVFVKGCPLRCLWCHNPETISAKKQLLFHDSLCSGCRKCENICEKGVHSFSGTGHLLDRSRCFFCGSCVENCLQDALKICGQSYSPEELLPILLKDKMFFFSGGGVTFSGGEPLLYPEFVRKIFSLLHRNQVHTALDTCGEIPFESFEMVLPYTDLILFDIKGMNPERHIQNTGKTNLRIHENLRRLNSCGVPVEIRMPVVPGCNDDEEEFHAAGKFLKECTSVKAIRLLPYHAMAREKYHAAAIQDTMPDAATPDEMFLCSRAGILKQYCSVPIFC